MFSVITVPDDAADLIEQLGTKLKFWFHNAGSGQCLYKEVRQDTGEDWSEKVACELCTILGLPHAEYDLATWRGRRGVATPSFVPARGQLVHGNELLVKVVPGYPGTKRFRVRQYALRLVLALLRDKGLSLPIGWPPVPGVNTAADVFVGYLMLDAWIGNTDRHHENWSLVVSPTMTIHLAPTYDHASSLGRNESDENRMSRLATRDEGWSVRKYVERASSAFYSTSGAKPVSTLEAFQEAAKAFPDAARAWLGRLEGVSAAHTLRILEEVPPHLISEAAIRFAQKVLTLNRERLLQI